MKSLQPQKSLVEQTYGVILDALCDGTLRPGERLTQEDIAARLNVSRHPVAQAFELLKSQGFLRSAGKRGLVVNEIDRDFSRAIYEFRTAVEPLAVRLATPRMRERDIIRGKSLVEHGRNMVLAGDARSSLQADMDFHLAIYEWSGNPIIRETMSLYWLHLRRAMGEVLRHPGMSVGVWNEHRRILDAMISGEADTASELMRHHLNAAKDRFGKSGVQNGDTRGNPA